MNCQTPWPQRRGPCRWSQLLSTTQRDLHKFGDVKAALQLLARKEKPSEKPSGFQAAETENRMVS